MQTDLTYLWRSGFHNRLRTCDAWGTKHSLTQCIYLYNCIAQECLSHKWVAWSMWDFSLWPQRSRRTFYFCYAQMYSSCVYYLCKRVVYVIVNSLLSVANWWAMSISYVKWVVWCYHWKWDWPHKETVIRVYLFLIVNLFFQVSICSINQQIIYVFFSQIRQSAHYH